MADPTKVSHMHLSLFPMASLVGHQPIAAVNIKKGKTYTNIALHMHFFPYMHSLTLPTHTSLVLFFYMHTNYPDHFFISRSLISRAERGRDTAELDIREPKQSVGSLGLILCHHLLSSRTHMHKHSLWFLSVSPSALCLLDRIVVGLSFQSKLLHLYFASTDTNSELNEDGPSNKLEEKKHYQTNRTLGLSKQAR